MARVTGLHSLLLELVASSERAGMAYARGITLLGLLEFLKSQGTFKTSHLKLNLFNLQSLCLPRAQTQDQTHAFNPVSHVLNIVK